MILNPLDWPKGGVAVASLVVPWQLDATFTKACGLTDRAFLRPCLPRVYRLIGK